MLFPLVTPEIVMGVALFLVFTQVYTGVPRGFTTQLLGHITFSISYVVVIVRGRLAAIGPQYEEAARDLGANRLQAMRLVLLPLLGPAIFASLMVVFAGSIDDFVISSFLSTGASSETVPMKIYAGGGPPQRPRSTHWRRSCWSFTLAAVSLAAIVMRQHALGGKVAAKTPSWAASPRSAEVAAGSSAGSTRIALGGRYASTVSPSGRTPANRRSPRAPATCAHPDRNSTWVTAPT